MFTGLVEAVGLITRVDSRGRDRRLRIEPGADWMADLRPGDSIAVAGACLTAVDPDSRGFCADVSGETLDHTTLGDRGTGDRVNLERALLPTTRLGGHLVSGHVDGVGEVVRVDEDGRSWRYQFRAPRTLARYLAPKGSVCIDGISLTINEVDGRTFGVNIIPHTMALTTLGDAVAGSRVNIEVDLIARYLERLLQGQADAAGQGGVSRELLARHGFIDGAGTD